MAQVALILSILLAAGIALFAVQNAGPVSVRFGLWSVELSLVVVILVAVAIGAILASLIGLPGWMRDRRRLRQQARELTSLRAATPPPAIEATNTPPPA